MALVFVPPPLKAVAGGRLQIEVDAATVGEAICKINDEHPGFAERLCVDGELSPALQVTVDQNASGKGLRTPLQADSEVHFLPMLGGG